ncbi:DUF2029 domain-containing protein [Candidatus Gottesmanbacteria bacterium]|nr:DUF2029 domain-containing protein [Candidatus Gottesmanbacteria bacterium]
MKVKSQTSNVKSLLVGYAIASIALFLYSFTQVDLSLTLSSSSWLQTIQKSFQYVGFFERPTSTALFVGIIGFWFVLYALALRRAHRGLLGLSSIWKIVGVVTILLILSYPAFSYDLFNYIFTAKTVLIYHKNPYEVIPLQFAGIDPLVAVMRWTHLPSAYTPAWILLTLPAYLLGFGKMVFVIWNLKLFVALFYLLAVRGVKKVLEKVDPARIPLGVAIFALNPLVIIESLVSAHNDIVMVALSVWAILLLLEQKYISSWVVLSFSVAIKLMTITLAPIFIAAKYMADWRKWSLIALGIGFLMVLSRREPLPWYWIWFMPFIAFYPSRWWLTTLSTWYAFALLLRYAPYLYYGNWNAPVPILKWWVTIVPIIVALGIIGMGKMKAWSK